MNKVAQVTIFFWLMKICATTLGETGGDLLSMTLELGYGISSLILIAIFLILLVVLIKSSRFNPVLFWTMILITSTVGTTMSDYMNRTLELGYATGSLILITSLIAILIVWHLSEKTLSVNNIQTPRAELFYWAAILVTNTLGTSLGDYLAHDSGLGFLGGVALIGGLLGLVVLARYLTPLNPVLLFWIAVILTRPFGATFGDLLTKSHEDGGLDIGPVSSSAILACLLVGFVIYTSMTEKRVSPPQQNI